MDIPEELVNAPEKRSSLAEKNRREERKQAFLWDCDGFVRSRARLAEIPMGPPKIYPFLLDQIGDDFTMGFFGKRREGKSFLMRNILYHMRSKFPRVYVMTNTRFNGFWQQYVPKNYIFDGYRPGVLADILEVQKNLRMKQIDNPSNETIQDLNINCLLILDDVIDQDLFHTELLKTLFYNGRHVKLCLMISLQYAKGIPPGK